MKANPLKRIRPWMWILGAIVLLVVALIILMTAITWTKLSFVCVFRVYFLKNLGKIFSVLMDFPQFGLTVASVVARPAMW